VHYLVNFDTYANELCVNQKVEDLNCNGQCQLSKEIKSTNSNSDNSQKPVELMTSFLSPFIGYVNKNELIPIIVSAHLLFPMVRYEIQAGFEQLSTPPPQFFS